MKENMVAELLNLAIALSKFQKFSMNNFAAVNM